MADTTILGLCSGVGMLEEGIAAGLRYIGRKPLVLARVERDAFAAAVLLARMASKALEPSPVWAGNLEDVRWEQFHGCVDILCAGFPCQPHSMAGSRKGVEDTRWIWPAIADCIRAVEPGIVLLENVSGLRSSGGFAPVLADLAALGFRVEWDSVRASDVGASHQRERVFILAYREGGRLRELRESSGSDGLTDGGDSELANSASRNRPQFARTDQRGFQKPDGRFDGAMDDANGSERRSVGICGSGGEQRTDGEREADCWIGIAGSSCFGDAILQHGHLQQREDGAEQQGAGGELDNPNSNGAQRAGRTEQGSDAGREELADASQQGQQRRELGRTRNTDRGGQEAHGPATEFRSLFAPGPSDPRWPGIIARWPNLAPATAKSDLCRLVDGLASRMVEPRTDRLRCGGNGVVATCAGIAFVTLARRAWIAA